jgi:hypothetical protein
MDKFIYGLDLGQPFDAKMVRDAVAECLYQANCDCVRNGEEGLLGDNIQKETCRAMVEHAFSASGGDYQHPDKQSLLQAIDNLQVYALSFRESDVVRKHHQQMLDIINML